jgi:hypothetical protein
MFGLNLFFFIVFESVVGQTDLVCSFVVFAHDENQSNNCADETTHIGKVGVDLVETATVSDSTCTLHESNLSQRCTNGRSGIGCFNIIGHSYNFLNDYLLIGHNADISFYCLLFDR